MTKKEIKETTKVTMPSDRLLTVQLDSFSVGRTHIACSGPLLVALMTVLHRLFASGSDRAAERWREDYLIPGAEELELFSKASKVALLTIPRSATTVISRNLKRCCIRLTTGKSVLTSAVLPGHISEQSGRPWTSSVIPTTICFKSGRLPTKLLSPRRSCSF
jgi:hypothetical protein